MRKNKVINPYVFPGIKSFLLPKSFITKHLRMHPDDLMKIIAKETSVSVSEISSPIRTKQLIIARHIFCGILKDDYNFTYTHIAKLISRDHTTIIHAVKQYRNRKYLEQSFLQYVELIREKIQNS